MNETINNGADAGRGPRGTLLAESGVIETRRDIAGVSTSFLEMGDGPPMVLLHGQGGFGAMWAPVMQAFAGTHRVVVPDLPGLGESTTDRELDEDIVLEWLDEIVRRQEARPVLVGTSLGGSIGARYAARFGDGLDRLVLVAAGGLVGPVRPQPAVLYRLIRHSIRPSERTGSAMTKVILHDAEAFRERMGDRADAFAGYMLELARRPSVKAANRQLLKKLGFPQIPSETLESIEVPTDMIWGRHDRVMALADAEEASRRFDWPLHVIDDAAHAPFAEQPDQFNAILRSILD